jgi:formylglycine-generating enzyme required for sulfatase activity
MDDRSIRDTGPAVRGRRCTTEYADFDLLITRIRTNYHAQVISSPAGDGTATVRLPVPQATGAARKKGRGERHFHAAEGSSREDGTALFQSVFKEGVGARWRESLAKLGEGRGLSLRLRLEGDAGLVGLPWECLYDPDQRAFLALKAETPVVRYLAVPAEPLPKRSPIPVKILVVTANPQDTEALDIGREVREIREALAPLGSRVRVEHVDRPTLTELGHRLEGCDVLHFSGHGSQGALIMEGRDGQPRTVDVHDLAGLLPLKNSLRFVFLNTCQGARIAAADAFSGVAQVLVQKGVPAVVAMRHDVGDDAAILFASRLYKALAEGISLPEAVGLGRKAIVEEPGDAWALPALYMRQEIEVVPPRRPLWWKAAAAAALLVLLSGLAVYGIPRLIDSYECPSPPGLGMRFVKIPGGSFLMGSTTKGSLEGPAHQATLSPFCLGAHEVTQAQWRAVIQGDPSTEKGDDLPVETISWNDVQGFLKKLNEMDPSGHYRLPTEAQWEYAASGGGRGAYGYGEDDTKLPEYANCSKRGQPTPVGSFRATRWGLYDMHGNVAEWVADLERYDHNPVVDPMGPPRSDELGVRGGSSWDDPSKCRAAHRDMVEPSARDSWIGFRVVRDPAH